MKEHLTEPPSAEGGGCEALGGSYSFTQNYLFKRFIIETPLRLRLRRIHLSLSERLWFANVRLPKGSPYGIAGAVRLRGIFTSINFSNCAINPNLTATFSQQNTHTHRRGAPCASAFQILICRGVSFVGHPLTANAELSQRASL